MENINRKVNRADTADRRELLQSPDIIQAERAVRHATLNGSDGSEILWGLIIEAPTYPEPPDDPDGRSYYTLRPVGTTYTIWESGQDYIVCNYVAYPTVNDPCYHCIADCPDSTTSPPDDPTHWEKVEEIRIEYVMGNEQSPAKDLRNCVPWYKAGDTVPYVSRIVSENTRYYLYQPFYTGEPEASSLRHDPDEGRVMVVYK